MVELRKVTRNDLIASLLARCPVDIDAANRAMMMDRRGEGVPVIMNDSIEISGMRPTYQLVGEELQLTLYAATGESR